MGEPATLVLLGDDYDGGHKAWVRWPDGRDDIEIRLASGSGTAPRAVTKGASGGELSRVMLAIKTVLADIDMVPTLVFDDGRFIRVRAEYSVGVGRRTPIADQELAEFRSFGRGAVLGSFFYHYARLIDMLYATERIEELRAALRHGGRKGRRQSTIRKWQSELKELLKARGPLAAVASEAHFTVVTSEWVSVAVVEELMNPHYKIENGEILPRHPYRGGRG